MSIHPDFSKTIPVADGRPKMTGEEWPWLIWARLRDEEGIPIRDFFCEGAMENQIVAASESEYKPYIQKKPGDITVRRDRLREFVLHSHHALGAYRLAAGVGYQKNGKACLDPRTDDEVMSNAATWLQGKDGG